MAVSANPSKVPVPKPNGGKPSAWLSAAVISGNTVYLSGLTGQTPDGAFVKGTVQDRTRQIFRNAQAQLEYVGLALSDIVSIQIFLSKYEQDFAPMNEAYIAELKDYGPFPVRTCVGVAALPAGTDVEMTIIAAKRHGGVSL